MEVNNNKLTSEIKLDGIVLKKGDKKEKVNIEGDAVEATPRDSFIEGAVKGVGVLLTGGAYPLVAGGLKAFQSYNEVEEASKKLDNQDEWASVKAGLKGALLGGVKGTLHGILDSIVIGGLTAGAVAVMGPFGFLMAPVIGGVYNVVKDAVRS